MKTRIFTYVECSCGHRGALIETIDGGAFRAGVCRAWPRKLTCTGTYDGDDRLFAEMKPGCPACGQSLSPDNVVGRSELQGTGDVLSLKQPKSPDSALGAGI